MLDLGTSNPLSIEVGNFGWNFTVDAGAMTLDCCARASDAGGYGTIGPASDGLITA